MRSGPPALNGALLACRRQRRAQRTDLARQPLHVRAHQIDRVAVGVARVKQPTQRRRLHEAVEQNRPHGRRVHAHDALAHVEREEALLLDQRTRVGVEQLHKLGLGFVGQNQALHGGDHQATHGARHL
jgi:hypothetical protein